MWLVFVSLVFYGFWQPPLVMLLSASIFFNFTIAALIRRNENRSRVQDLLLFAGVAANLAALIYYKYAFWLLRLLGTLDLINTTGLHAVVLPLGISFFTFTQIGYLVDCRQNVTKENGFLSYALFVTFFPHLIAGPILHNGEIMPQFADAKRFRLNSANIGAGLTLFVIGMLKKSLIADSLSAWNNTEFSAASHLQLFGSWGCVLGYSLQLYFDFSGYSDMAIGLALLFNIRFPLNFNSPYKATSIIDFWQRWHMTLTRYITLYIYNPIALSISRRRLSKGLPVGKKALARPWPFIVLIATPTFITMALAGIWHGAGLQFLIFGLLHATYLTINHAWRNFGPRTNAMAMARISRWSLTVAQALVTYLAVLVAQVFFRAATVADAMTILSAMLGLRGVERPLVLPRHLHGILGTLGERLAANGVLDFHMNPDTQTQILIILLGYLVVYLLPNSQEIMANSEPVTAKVESSRYRFLVWQPTARWAVVASVAALVALMSIGGTHEFLYFQF